MITLIIVDCQNDFITGTMTVKGAKNSVEEIKKFIKNHRKEISKIIFTVDWHPYNHSSFKKYGGQWPHPGSRSVRMARISRNEPGLERPLRLFRAGVGERVPHRHADAESEDHFQRDPGGEPSQPG